jgi:LuxR family transcriptional regulator, maltose regulon positive regulatory protein
MVPMPDIVASKLRVPPRKATHVDRPRLVSRLDEGLAGKVTVITAPAGSGKTTLLAAWIEATARRVAWLSLDAGDDDMMRFLEHAVAALHDVAPAPSERARRLLDTHHRPTPTLVFGTILAALDDESLPFSIVFDDFHLITSAEVHEGIAFLIAHAPADLQVVIATRVDPPLALARLRAHGELHEVRAGDLRFTTDEASAFLRVHQEGRLSRTEVELLEARTEGWVAGLQLVALALRGRSDVSAFVARFSGSHTYIVDYLAEEVLASQSDVVQSFLLATSILDRLTGPLCDALTGRRDGAATLRHLERSNLFVVPLDDERRWYRYHRLFADVLQDRLRQTASVDDLSDLHRRAAAWFEGAGLPFEAVDHALAAGDAEAAARIVESVAESLWSRGELTSLRAWLDKLPREVVHRRPRLLLTKAWCRFLMRTYDVEPVSGLLDEAERSIAALEARADPPLSPEEPAGSLRSMLAAVRAAVASAQEDAGRTLAYAREARSYARGIAGPWQTVLALSEGLAYDAVGDARAAEGALESAASSGRADGNAYVAAVATVNLARVRLERGRLRAAATSGAHALELVGDHDGGRSPVASYPHVVLGRVAYEWNDLSGAIGHFEAAIERARLDGHARALVDGYLGLALARRAAGSADGALEAMRSAEAFVGGATAPWAAPLVMWQRALHALRAGRFEEAAGFADRATDAERGVRNARARSAPAVEVRVLAARGLLDEALALVDRSLEEAEAGGRTRTVYELSIVKALVQQQRGAVDEATRTMAEVVPRTEPDGFVRIFVDEAEEPMIALLGRLLHDGVAPDYTTMLLGSVAAPPARPHLTQRPDVEPDSFNERERSVLRLMAARRTDKEIAKALSLSVSTVKWYSHRIFGKLGAHTRGDAVARARALGIV